MDEKSIMTRDYVDIIEVNKSDLLPQDEARMKLIQMLLLLLLEQILLRKW